MQVVSVFLFTWPKQALFYLAHHTHPGDIANSLPSQTSKLGLVTFKWKDCRRTRDERRAKRGAESKGLHTPSSAACSIRFATGSA